MGLFKWLRTGNEEAFAEDDTDDDVGLTECNDYVCERCGTTFVLGEAISEFENHFNGDLSYSSYFWEKVCGDCAISDIESRMTDD